MRRDLPEAGVHGEQIARITVKHRARCFGVVAKTSHFVVIGYPPLCMQNSPSGRAQRRDQNLVDVVGGE